MFAVARSRVEVARSGSQWLAVGLKWLAVARSGVEVARSGVEVARSGSQWVIARFSNAQKLTCTLKLSTYQDGDTPFSLSQKSGKLA